MVPRKSSRTLVVVRKCLSRLAHTFIRGEFCNYLTGLGGKPLPDETFAERNRRSFLEELH